MPEDKERITILSKKDLSISYFVGSGAGGQNKQKNSTGVQLIHKETGAIGRCSDTRSQEQNKKLAFKRLLEHPKMKVWISKKLFEVREGESLEDRVNREVDKQMAPENLIIETYESK